MGKVIMSGIVPKTTIPATKPTISELSVGSSIFLNVNNVSTEFIIVNQGIPSNSNGYDSSCNGTWLLMKDIYINKTMHPNYNAAYPDTTIHNYLNNDFHLLLGSKEQSAVLSVKIPYIANGIPSSSNQRYGANGLSTKWFILSKAEIGKSVEDATSGISYATKLDYFLPPTDSDFKERLKAYLNGSLSAWWLRDSNDYNNKTDKFSYAFVSSSDSSLGGITSNTYARADNENGVRPACVVSFDTKVKDNGDGTYSIA